MVQGIASNQALHSIESILNNFSSSMKDVSALTNEDIENINE